MNWNEFKIWWKDAWIFVFIATAMIGLCMFGGYVIYHNAQYEMKCEQQGGHVVRGGCIADEAYIRVK